VLSAFVVPNPNASQINGFMFFGHGENASSLYVNIDTVAAWTTESSNESAFTRWIYSLLLAKSCSVLPAGFEGFSWPTGRAQFVCCTV
jgi:hypothetical protein